MSERRIKHITALAVWTILQAFYVALHFSWGNVIVLGIGFMILLLGTVFHEYSEITLVVNNLVEMLSMTCLVFLCYCVVSDIIPAYWGVEGGFGKFFEDLGYGIGWFFRNLKINFLVVIPLLVVLFFIGRSDKHPLLKILKKYMFWCVIIISLFSAFSTSLAVGAIIVIIALCFVACDVMDFLNYNIHSNDGIWWFRGLTLGSLLLLFLRPNALALFDIPGYVEQLLIVDGFPWYFALLLIAVFGLAAGIIWKLDSDDQSGISIDAFIFWNAAWITVALFFLSRFFVGYWWVLMVLYGGGIAYSLVGLNPDRTRGKDNEKMSYLLVPILSVAVSLLAVFGHFGCLLVGASILVGVGGIVIAWIKLYKSDDWKCQAWFYTCVLLAVGVMALAFVYTFRRMTFNFLLLGAMLLVCIAFAWFLCYGHGQTVAKKSRILAWALAAVFAAGCVCMCARGGSTISVSEEDGRLLITNAARGENNDIVSVQYFWWDDLIAAAQNEDQTGFPREYELENGVRPNTDGRLRILVTDVNGVCTERIYWIHNSTFVAPVVQEEVVIPPSQSVWSDLLDLGIE